MTQYLLQATRVPSGGIFRKNLDTEEWQEVTPGLLAGDISYWNLLCPPNNPNLVIALCTPNTGEAPYLIKSENAGALGSWTLEGQFFTGVSTADQQDYTVAINEDGTEIYSYDVIDLTVTGIYKSTDWGFSWTQIATPAAAVTDQLAIWQRNGKLYVNVRRNPVPNDRAILRYDASSGALEETTPIDIDDTSMQGNWTDDILLAYREALSGDFDLTVIRDASTSPFASRFTNVLPNQINLQWSVTLLKGGHRVLIGAYDVDDDGGPLDVGIFLSLEDDFSQYDLVYRGVHWDEGFESDTYQAAQTYGDPNVIYLPLDFPKFYMSDDGEGLGWEEDINPLLNPSDDGFWTSTVIAGIPEPPTPTGNSFLMYVTLVGAN